MKMIFFLGIHISLPLGIIIDLVYIMAMNSFRIFYKTGKLPDSAKMLSLIFPEKDVDWIVMIILFLIVFLMIFSGNIRRYREGQREFSPFRKKSVVDISADKRKAQDQPVPQKYLSKEPSALTVGKYRNYYVNLPFNRSPEHQLILGSPGSHKSSTIINALIDSFNYAEEKDFHAGLIVDVKPELSRKSVDESRKDIKVISPSTFDRYGFDPFYGISPDASDDEVGNRCSTISQAIISSPGGKNEFFYKSAQNILSGRLMYCFRQGINIGEAITSMRDQPLEDLIAEIMADTDMQENHPKIQKRVKAYENKDSDAFQDIGMSIQESLEVFDTDSVIYCFSDDNPARATPEDLVNGISLFVAIPGNLIFKYSPVFRVIITLCLDHILSIPEWKMRNTKPYWFLIDEAGSIGPIPNLQLALAQGRSYGIQLSIIVQSFSQLNVTYGKDNADAILDCCNTTIVTSCNNPATAKIISDWCGTYRETKVSTSTHGKNLLNTPDSQNESIEYRPTMDVADIKKLRADFKVLVFIDGSWFLLNKSPYFTIRKYDDKVKSLLNVNARFYPETD